MPIVFVVDDTVSMSVHRYNKNSQCMLEACSPFVSKLLSEFKNPYSHYVSFYQRTNNSLAHFRNDYKTVNEQFRELVNGSEVYGEIRYVDILKLCDAEMTKLWGKSVKNTIIVLTDEGKHEKLFLDAPLSVDENFNSIVHVISFEEAKNHALTSVAEMTGGVSLCVKSDWNIASVPVNEISIKMAELLLKSGAYHLCPSSGHVTQGHFEMNVKLFPFVDLFHSNDKNGCRFQLDKSVNLSQLSINIIGFLALIDLNYPCVLSDHIMVHCEPSSNNTENTQQQLNESIYYAQLLNTGLLNTKSAAICTVKYIGDPKTTKNPRYGLIRNIVYSETKYTLKFSLFPIDYNGLPWIGKFANLTSHNLLPEPSYNSSNNSSPFPVKIPNECSYKPTADNKYQYTTWVTSSGSVVNDFSKIVRISKRLPERKAIFFKEVNRFKETALTIGSPSLLSNLCRMFEKELSHSGSNNANSNLTSGTSAANQNEAHEIIKYVIESLTNTPFAMLQTTLN